MRRAGIGYIASPNREQRVRYYWWWRKYLVLKYASRAGILIGVACVLAPFAEKSLASFAWAAKPAFLLSVASGIWWAFLDCPRCGERFRSWYTGDLDYFGDDCQNCGLTSSELSAIAQPRD